MTARILIVKNITREGPGILRDVLQDGHVGADMIDISRGEAIPGHQDYDAVVVLGGPSSATDKSASMRAQIELVRQVLDAQKPFLGICLGMQVLVKAAGGGVTKLKNKEIGFVDSKKVPYTLQLTEAGSVDPLFANMPNEFPVFQLHGETVRLVDGIELLATGDGVKNQVVRVGANAYGIQAHVELVPEMLAVWLAQDPELAGFDGAQMQTQLGELSGEYMDNAKSIFNNFLSLAGLSAKSEATLDITEKSGVRNG